MAWAWASAGVGFEAGVGGFPRSLGGEIFGHVGLRAAGLVGVEQAAGFVAHQAGGFGFACDYDVERKFRETRLWDPATGIFAKTAAPPPGHDLFCSGHTLLEDGRLFVAGGHFAVGVGQPFAAIYDPNTPGWALAPEMEDGRWYPSATTLADVVQHGAEPVWGAVESRRLARWIDALQSAAE